MRVSLIWLMFAVGCSSSSAGSTGANVDDAATPASDDGVVADSVVLPSDGSGTDPTETGGTAYPSGPYGHGVGDVLADLGLEGYVRFAPTTGLASEVSYGATSLADLRAKSPKKYAVLHVSGFT